MHSRLNEVWVAETSPFTAMSSIASLPKVDDKLGLSNIYGSTTSSNNNFGNKNDLVQEPLLSSPSTESVDFGSSNGNFTSNSDVGSVATTSSMTGTVSSWNDDPRRLEYWDDIEKDSTDAKMFEHVPGCQVMC